MTGEAAKGYVVGDSEFLYPGVGDPRPPGGAKVLLKTKGGICILGVWDNDPFIIGWCGLPRENKDKEQALGLRTK